MIDYIFPLIIIFFALFSFILSKSEKNYKKLVENNGKEFANKINNYLKIGGYLLFLCSIIWIGINIIS
jgi:isoprenylcysteine carboxyl methyltransferase (ICMT) family protein YpbQ